MILSTQQAINDTNKTLYKCRQIKVKGENVKRLRNEKKNGIVKCYS